MIDLLKDNDLAATGTYRRGRAEYRLVRDLEFEDVRVPRFFVTDKYSLPGRLIPWIWQPKQCRWATPAVLHDWLFETKLKPFGECNALFMRAMTAAGVKLHHRHAAYWAVQAFGRSGYGLVAPQNIPLVRPHRRDLVGVLRSSEHRVLDDRPLEVQGRIPG